MEWMVVIDGDENILEDLALSCTDPKLTITKHQDNYVLKSSHFNELTSSDEVMKNAEKLLDWISGTTTIELYQSISLKASHVIQLSENGKHTIYDVAMSEITLTSGVCDIVHKDTDGNLVPKTLSVPELVTLCETDENVAKVIELWQHDSKSWSGLYKVHEAIQEDSGDIFKTSNVSKIISKEKLGIFTQTANSYDASGKEGRHGHTKVEQPKIIMKLSEAKVLIWNILLHWIKLKKESISNS